jgi:pyruvate dehydrogenase E2 component (dihydrolipoamide acetyltransferase)
MAIPVLMPRQGNTVEECLLAAWKKKKGDKVTKGESIADIETDKATFELEAPSDGILLDIFAEAGTLVPIMTNIGAIGNVGESVEEFRPAPKDNEKKQEGDPSPLPSSTPSPLPAKEPTSISTPNESPMPSPRAQKYLESHPIPTLPKLGSGPNGRILESDLQEIYMSGNRLSPLAAELISEGWRSPASGSGPADMILKNDLLPPGKALSGIRSIIAARMKESLSTTAQYTVSMKAPATGLLALRKRIKPLSEAGKLADISINDLVNFAVIKTVVDFPEINAGLIDGVLYTYKNVNLAFACDTKKGLLVPVIRNAHLMNLSELARASKTLAASAIEGRILPDDLSGGTFTVSNLGGFGVTEFTPVINTPQTAILGVCGISLEAVRSRDGTIIFEDRIGFSLTSDHQVVDGAMAARFLKKLSETVANIESTTGLNL